MKKKYALLLCLLFPVCILNLSCTGPAGPAGPGGGYVMIFQQGVAPYASYAGCADTRIVDGANSGDNFGGANNVLMGTRTTGKLRFLVRFDLTAIVPATTTVDKAYLTLYTGSTITGSYSITAYPITAAWDEGTGVLPGDPDDGATWANRTSALSWGAGGGDYTASKPGSSSAVPSGSSQPVTISIDPATVTGWIANPSANYGVLVIPSKENLVEDNYSSFFTRDYVTDITLRPKLTVYLKP